MKRKILNIAAVLLFAGSLQAQQLDSYITDIFNFSQLGLDGTASYVGRAGAIGALGGDFTAGSYNPAGLGLFYSSQISFSPSVNWVSDKNSYMGLNEKSNYVRFNLSDMAVLLAVPVKSEGWRAWQFGIGFNKLKNFNNRIYAEGDWTTTSIVDSWVADADADPDRLDPFGTAMAYDTWVIDTLAGGRTFFNNFAGHTNQLYQTEQITESGWENEMTISFSGNYSDKLYLGATIGVPFLSYHRTEIYRETAGITDEYFDYTSDRDMSGTGINLKLGAIYRPIENLRIGFAFHTPTLYDMDEVYANSLYNCTNTRTYYTESVEGASTFYFRTPLKLIGSVAVTLGNMSSPVAGSLDFDYEFTNYDGMAFRNGDDYETDLYYESWKNSLNRTISHTYQPAHTFRLGGTLNIKKFALRAGWAYTTNPYQEGTGLDASSNMFSAGVGYQNEIVFIDFAYANISQKDEFTLVDPTEVLSVSRMNNLFVLTFGLKF